jgi:alpha-L-glutamate ligase-like protein
MGLLRIWQNRKKVLGLNARYLDFIRPYNSNKAIRIADNKVRTKKVLKKHGIPTPEIIANIRNKEEVAHFDFDKLPKSFVVKPVFGSEGRGIDIFYNRKGDHFIKASGEKVHIEDLRTRFQEIIDGRFSMFNQPDQVLIEERVKPHNAFRYYTFKGTPDVRIIMFNGIPVMAMLRIPTEMSEGKANLKLGAIGAAIDIAAGRVTTAIIGKSERIELVPHTKLHLSGLEIPEWQEMLRIAAEVQEVTGLGYACIDFLLDKERGPIVVEIGARAGLSIQLADEEGLRGRLDRVKGIKVKSLKHGISIGKSMFGGEIIESLEEISGRAIIGRTVKVILNSKAGDKVTVLAKVDTGAYSTSIDTELMRQLGYGEVIDAFNKFEFEADKIDDTNYRNQLTEQLNSMLEETDLEIEKTSSVSSSHGKSLRPAVMMKVEIKGRKISSRVTIQDRKDLRYSVILGRRTISGKFLIDPQATYRDGNL